MKIPMDIQTYIENQKSPQKEICWKLHEIIFAIFPNITEKMKWGVPAFADGTFYIVALKDHVNLGFSKKGLSEEESSLFDGGGKTTVHLTINTLKDIDHERIIKLIKLVDKRQKE
jgi:hypothetical protein